MKIGIVFTGGTIGSAFGADGYIAPDSTAGNRLVEMYKNSTGGADDNEIEFIFSSPYIILSEMLSAEYIVKLAGHVESLLDGGTDGLIVTHGTDTLPYASALLSYIAGAGSIPVVMVSADYPLEDSRSNGLENFRCAVEFIRKRAGKGVFISYKNREDGFVTVHRGSRALAYMPYSSSVYSVAGQYYARFAKGRFEINASYRGKNEKIRCLPHLPVPSCADMAASSGLIRRIRAYPGMEYPEICCNIRAVLLETYHSGTLCTDDRFAAYVKKLEEKGILLFLSGVDDRNAAYETMAAYDKPGITILPRMSPEAAYCKLWLLLSCGRGIDDMTSCIGEDFA